MTQSVIKHVHQAYDTIMLPHSEMASVHKPPTRVPGLTKARDLQQFA